MASRSNISSQLSYVQDSGLISLFRKAARQWNIPLPLLLAVASRETKMGTDSYFRANNFTGIDGHGKGIMQIDDRYHSFALLTPPGNHQAYINYGAEFLSSLQDQFGSMKEALVAYNAGPDAVYEARAQGVDPDNFTTGGNYAKDVQKRAALIASELGINFATIASTAPALLLLLGGSSYLYYQLTGRKPSLQFLES